MIMQTSNVRQYQSALVLLSPNLCSRHYDVANRLLVGGAGKKGMARFASAAWYKSVIKEKSTAAPGRTAACASLDANSDKVINQVIKDGGCGRRAKNALVAHFGPQGS